MAVALDADVAGTVEDVDAGVGVARVDEDLVVLLEPSATTTRCPYKGVAVSWSVRQGDALVEDLVWSYPAPIPECPKLENLLSFFNEKVDITVDGELQPRPTTEWS